MRFLPLLAIFFCVAACASPTTNEECTGCGASDADIDDTVGDLVPPDAAPVCPAVTHECVPSIPEGFRGPAIRADQDAGDTARPCPTAYGDSPVVLSWNILAEGSCECQCGGAISVNCTAATITGKSGNDPIGYAPCTAGCPSCETIEVEANTCVSIGSLSGDPLLEVRLGKVNSANCPDGISSNNLEAAFQDQVSLCTAPAENVLAGCEVGHICAPKALGSFRNQCIYKMGDEVCPDAIFTERQVVFEDLIDDRNCSPCNCQKDGSLKCGSALLMSVLDQSCGSASPEPLSGCADGIVGSASVYYDVDPSAHQCVQSGTTSVVGDAQGVEPVTICCTP